MNADKCFLVGRTFDWTDPYDPTLYGGLGPWGNNCHSNEDYDPPFDQYPCPACGRPLDIMDTLIIPDHAPLWIKTE